MRSTMKKTIGAIAAHFVRLFSPLRHRNFRFYWAGLVAQVGGQQMMAVTLGWLAFDLSGSPLTLGMINLLQAAPRILLNLLGGAMADRLDRRLIITLGQTGAALVMVTLAVLTTTGAIEIWHLGAGAVVIGFVLAFDEPSRQALLPSLLPNRSMLAEAIPVVSIAWQLNRIVAPAVAGFVIAASGAGTSFFISAAGAATMAALVRMIRLPHVSRRSKQSLLRTAIEGAVYVRRNPVFRVVIGLAFFNSIFALGYMLMMPVFAANVFEVDSRGLGVMYSAAGAGGILGLLTVSPLVRGLGPGRVIVGGLGLFAGSLIAFALSPTYLLALGFLAVAGYAGHLYTTSGDMVLQMFVPDALRGRVMGLYAMLWAVMPLGAAGLNTAASFIGARYALAGGASLVLLAAITVAAAAPGLRRVRLPDAPAPADEPAAQPARP
ncbi:MAG: MFS transporter [Chloroflexi bacterium]|nr:MFS transporter [Chloroflexota bacterium]